MADIGFFEESRDQSVVKATIVSKYFDAWSSVIVGTQNRFPRRSGNRLAYIDLFAGPGRYSDGTRSTPLLVLDMAIADPELRSRLVTIFNDKTPEFVRSLEHAVEELPGIDTLTHRPQLKNLEVAADIARLFDEMRLVPTLLFVDPWGYEGLSLRLVNSVLKDWGCDCIFFFNYSRINMGLSNPLVQEHMEALFGPERAEELRRKLGPMLPEEREVTIVEELAQALKGMGGKFVLPFRFKRDRSTRTSHHLVFVSKSFKGYEIMKDIMAVESTSSVQGVPTFEYNPAQRRQPLLFDLARPLEDLQGMLLNDFAGRSLKMVEVYLNHSIDKPFIKRNYKGALVALEASGQITAKPSSENRKPATFADHVLVSFPPRGA